MSYYYKYNFISPEIIYATVKEELKSYFDTGVVDDLMFPTYLYKALRKLGRTTLPIMEIPLFIENFTSRLPDNFHAVKEAWMCTAIAQPEYKDPNSFYSQSASATTIQIAPVVTNGLSCADPVCSDTDMPEIAQEVFKTTYTAPQLTYQQQYLLKPGNISARSNCSVSYNQDWRIYGQNPYSNSIDSFDIRDNKFITNFRDGVVHLIFYAEDFDKIGNQLVPDNYRIMEYVEAFLKFKVYETLTNLVTDETFNQLQQKMMMYKSMYEEAFIMADIETKKQTVHQKQRKIIESKNRLNRFEIRDSIGRLNRNYKK